MPHIASRRRRLVALATGFAICLATGVAAVPAVAAPPGPAAQKTLRAQPVCSATAAPRHARCLSLLRTDQRVRIQGARADAGTAPAAGIGPAALASAYRLPGRSTSRLTVAVVDAFDNPTAEKDLNRYRTTFGLPRCTRANRCFTKLNQSGRQGHYPDVDEGWALESALDVDMVSAACPSCRILLVEAYSSSLDDLAASVDTAVRAGATVVTNSYGTDEFNGMASYARHYRHRGVAVVASSGDDGFTAASFPAVAPGVTAVGGTSLYRAMNRRGWGEQAWDGAGSGCSAYVSKPAYQKDRHCHMRTIADVSAVADPTTGVAVYDSTRNPFGVKPGWLVVGGTSASSPFIAGLIARAGNARTFTTGRLYANRSHLFDVFGGSNGFCGGDYLCTGLPGYDGPTGLGTPDGLGAF